MPSKYAIARAEMKYLGIYTGPSIAMTRADHKKTKSHGPSNKAQEHRNDQINLIKNGDFKNALKMDIDDINLKFPGRYDQGIAQLLIYQNILESTGYVK